MILELRRTCYFHRLHITGEKKTLLVYRHNWHKIILNVITKQHMESYKHRMVWVGRDFRSSGCNVPAVSMDTYHKSRLLKAPSSLALNTSRTPATSLGNLFQCLTTLIVKNFFLLSNLNFPSFSLKPLLLVLSLHTLVKTLSSFFVGPFRYWKAAMRSAQSLLFSRMNSPNSLNLAS